MDAKQAALESLKNSYVWKRIQDAITDGDFKIMIISDEITCGIRDVLEKLNYEILDDDKGISYISWKI